SSPTRGSSSCPARGPAARGPPASALVGEVDLSVKRLCHLLARVDEGPEYLIDGGSHDSET
ncbi:hypothetical protein, partial [Streptomyces sp. NPDC005077]|uniref:hypothetical protein n=1 Tax=Streptomyces sp. NPDC005077 TaxID=3154292 RepID=UPI0033A587C2